MNPGDLTIAVYMVPIDGVGGILGQAGPCGLDNSGMSRFGIMEFDEADANDLITEGTFEQVVLHEMGHVLGLGTLWEERVPGLLDDTSNAPYIMYTGTEGIQGHAQIGRSGMPYVEDLGGVGTRRGHWKESLPRGYRTELMTGYIEPAGVPMPLSVMTVRALRDLGFVTNVAEADPFTSYFAGVSRTVDDTAALQGRRREYGNDILDFERKRIPSQVIPGRETEYMSMLAKYKSDGIAESQTGGAASR